MLKSIVRSSSGLREGVPLSRSCVVCCCGVTFRERDFSSACLADRVVRQEFGGEIVVESGTFESGVRIEVYRGATLRIGKGTYLNRNVHIVAADR